MRKKPKKTEHKRAETWPWVLLAAAMVFSAVVRIRLLGMPLERDEGEFAYMGQLMLYGIAPYEMAYNMKLPGIYAAYAVVMRFFGQSSSGIHMGLLLVNAACICLTFALTKRLFGSLAAGVSAVAYALLTISPNVNGIAAHATHFVVLFALAGILLVLRAAEHRGPWLYFLGGLMLGFSFLMKQPGAAFGLLALGIAIRKEFFGAERAPGAVLRLGAFCLGGLVPPALMVLWLWNAGVFDRFVFWTVTYCREYARIVGWREGLENFDISTELILRDTWPIYVVALAGLLVTAVSARMRTSLGFVLALLLCSIAATSAGLYFRPHYFVVAFPVVAALAGAALEWAIHRKQRRALFGRAVAIVLLGFSVGYPVFVNRSFLFSLPPNDASRIVYGANPFPESVEIAKYIRAHTNEKDTIAVLGSEPQIYFYSKRLAATAYIYMYPLMECQPYAKRMQMQMIRQVEMAQPKYIVYVPLKTSWLGVSESETIVLDWLESYLDNYSRVGLVDILRDDIYWTRYYWDADAVNRNPLSDCFVEIYERNRR